MRKIVIETLHGQTDLIIDNQDRICELLRQLSDGAPIITAQDVLRMLEQEDFFLIAAIEKGCSAGCFRGEIAGIGIIFFRETLMRYAGYIEDVVVLEKYRGLHLGEELGNFMIDLAKRKGAHAILLTSGNQRKSAHGLWRKLKFVEKDSTAFILPLK